MLKYAVLLGFVGVCLAQVPQPCVSPKQWQGRRVRRDRDQKFMEIEEYTYDETNMRTRAVAAVEQGKERDFYDTIRLYKEKKEYRLNLKTRQCNVTEPGHPFRMKGVPPGSKFLFESEVGAAQLPGEHLTVQNWEATFDDGAKFMIAVTSPDCVPIWSGYYNNKTGFELENYFDIVAGVPDPAVFLPPKECMK